MGDSTLGVVGHGTAKFLGRHLFKSDLLNHLWTGDKHITCLLNHDCEIGKGRRIYSPPGTGSHDNRYLRDDPGTPDISFEYLSVAAQAYYAFLNPGTSRILQSDNRRPVLESQIHDLADLLTEGAA